MEEARHDCFNQNEQGPFFGQSQPNRVCKVVMMNHDYYLVRETAEEIIQKIADYNAKVMDIHRSIQVVDNRN